MERRVFPAPPTPVSVVRRWSGISDAQFPKLGLSADEARERSRQVVLRRLQGLDRWEVADEAVGRDLEEAKLLIDVFQAMVAQVVELEPSQ